uniref:Uncharacterized protein n=1 Tax=Glossina morsitans morsitans TaxID=37546 RepID=A0ABK9NG07_GLOMM
MVDYFELFMLMELHFFLFAMFFLEDKYLFEEQL